LEANGQGSKPVSLSITVTDPNELSQVQDITVTFWWRYNYWYPGHMAVNEVRGNWMTLLAVSETN